MEKKAGRKMRVGRLENKGQKVDKREGKRGGERAGKREGKTVKRG